MSKYTVTVDRHAYEVELGWSPQSGSEFTARVNGETVHVWLPDLDAPLDEMEWMVIDGRPYEIVADRDLRWLRAYNGLHRLEVRDLEAAVARPRSGDGRLKAPIPGLITRVLVEPGQVVEMGETVLVLEAMKMENEIRASRAGTVTALHVTPGQSVARSAVLAEIG
jgi:acetyl/propionyl-CoA carboxylase alpha subunit